MAEGVIYCMSSSIPGVVKIGMTQTSLYNQRMKKLEDDGYKNMTGFRREFAIEVKDYEKKEKLIHEIFSKSRIGDTECFAVSLKLVKELLASLDGTQIFPRSDIKEKVFNHNIKTRKSFNNKEMLSNKELYEDIPDGRYYLERKVKNFGQVKGIMKVSNGMFIVLRGSICAPYRANRDKPDVVKKAIIESNILKNDVECTSPSFAGFVVVGQQVNGWTEWKCEDGRPLDVYRK